ncbi:DUF302 domain-containing protein [Halomonas sp. ML-15]|uniref:DUF302 domain-containing protein n=1 Tax=Halomonas sp. ML-15 TaxID=2773305 RepID=UPI001745D5EC|nr:DUF302 domain-containing protein [Halomonas sp. ML-15]MBD3895689.1 DUF302 domain-containing protein [Halomonas sp. ML-15]
MSRYYASLITALTAGLMAAGSLHADDAAPQGIERLSGSANIDDVESRLRQALDDRDLTLVQMVDHAANAANVELDLSETRLFMFGNPEVGTPMMQCQGSVALDLPQKMVIRQDGDQVHIEWNDPHYLAERHGLDECELPLDNVASVLSEVASEALGD